MWLEYIRTFGTPFIALCGLFGSGFALWVNSRTASKGDFGLLQVKDSEQGAKIVALEVRLKSLEETLQSAPTRHELQTDISRLSARMSGVESGLAGISKQQDTTNNYLHTIVESYVK